MLIVTGSLAYDYIMDFPGQFNDHILPTQLHQINLSFIVNTFAKRRGGTAGNVSYTLGLLQTDHVLFSTAGKDFTEYKEHFDKMRINTKQVKIYNNTYTATGFAMTDRNNNQIWGYFYGATDYVHTLQLKKFAKKNDLVLVGPQGAKGSLSFVKQCVELSIPYVFDPGFILTQVNDSDLTFGVTHARYVIGNDYEINLIKQRVKHFDRLTKNAKVITTLGEKGAMIVENKQTIIIKPAKPTSVVDPTGAGDAWRGGFLSGLMKNYDLEICGNMGAIAACYCLEQYGTQEHRYSKSQFTKRYKETYNKFLKL